MATRDPDGVSLLHLRLPHRRDQRAGSPDGRCGDCCTTGRRCPWGSSESCTSVCPRPSWPGLPGSRTPNRLLTRATEHDGALAALAWERQRNRRLRWQQHSGLPPGRYPVGIGTFTYAGPRRCTPRSSTAKPISVPSWRNCRRSPSREPDQVFGNSCMGRPWATRWAAGVWASGATTTFGWPGARRSVASATPTTGTALLLHKNSHARLRHSTTPSDIVVAELGQARPS